MVHASYVRVVRLPWVDCDQPLRLVRGCGAVRWQRCNCHRSSKCVPCSWRYRSQLVRITEAGITGEYTYTLTLSAPGTCQHRRLDPKLDGEWSKGPARENCRCHDTLRVCPWTGDLLDAPDLGRWNAHASRSWNRLRTKLAEVYPGLEFDRHVELQLRGAIHYHVVVRSTVPLDVHLVQRHAIAKGFGCSIDLTRIPAGDAGRKAALYASKYAAKCSTDATERGAVPWYGPHNVVVEEAWTDHSTGQVHPEVKERHLGHCHPTYRVVSRSHGWGLTMRQLREALRAAAAAAAAHRAELAADEPGSPADKGHPVLSGADPPT